MVDFYYTAEGDRGRSETKNKRDGAEKMWRRRKRNIELQSHTERRVRACGCGYSMCVWLEFQLEELF